MRCSALTEMNKEAVLLKQLPAIKPYFPETESLVVLPRRSLAKAIFVEQHTKVQSANMKGFSDKAHAFQIMAGFAFSFTNTNQHVSSWIFTCFCKQIKKKKNNGLM